MEDLTDYERKPGGSLYAEPVWSGRRWLFVPWVPGLGPYRRLVTTKAAAESLVCEFTQEIEAGNEEAHPTAIPVKDARLSDEVFIFQAAGANAGKFLRARHKISDATVKRISLTLLINQWKANAVIL